MAPKKANKNICNKDHRHPEVIKLSKNQYKKLYNGKSGEVETLKFFEKLRCEACGDASYFFRVKFLGCKSEYVLEADELTACARSVTRHFLATLHASKAELDDVNERYQQLLSSRQQEQPQQRAGGSAMLLSSSVLAENFMMDDKVKANEKEIGKLKEENKGLRKKCFDLEKDAKRFKEEAAYWKEKFEIVDRERKSLISEIASMEQMLMAKYSTKHVTDIFRELDDSQQKLEVKIISGPSAQANKIRRMIARIQIANHRCPQKCEECTAIHMAQVLMEDGDAAMDGLGLDGMPKAEDGNGMDMDAPLAEEKAEEEAKPQDVPLKVAEEKAEEEAKLEEPLENVEKKAEEEAKPDAPLKNVEKKAEEEAKPGGKAKQQKQGKESGKNVVKRKRKKPVETGKRKKPVEIGKKQKPSEGNEAGIDGKPVELDAGNQQEEIAFLEEKKLEVPLVGGHITREIKKERLDDVLDKEAMDSTREDRLIIADATMGGAEGGSGV